MAQKNNVVRRGKRWYVRFQVDGRDVWRSAGSSREAAQEMLPKLRDQAEREARGLSRKPQSTPTFSEWAPKFLAWSAANKRSYARDKWCMPQLVKVFGRFRLADIAKPQVEEFMQERRKEVSEASVNRQVALLRRVLSYAVQMRKMDVNPLLGIKMLQEAPARQPQLDLETEKKLLATSKPWLRFMIQLAVSTGCREGELLALRWRHVDFDGGMLIVEDSKSGQSRRLPLHPSMLAELKRRRQLPEGFVITEANGSVPTSSAVVTGFRRAVGRIGRPDLRFHDLRHIAGSRLLAAGAALPEVADFLGHKTLIIARRYAHTSQTRLKDLVARMPAGTPETEAEHE